MPESREETADRIRAVAELLGLSAEQLIIAAANGGAAAAVQEIDEPEIKPPPIVYPNIKFPRYKFREFPKLVYRGYIRDVEEPILKLVPNGQGGVNQVNAIRIIPDQFVMETKEVGSKSEEAMLDASWHLTLAGAKEAAKLAKDGVRPIVEKIVEPDDEDDGVMAMAETAPQTAERTAEHDRLLVEAKGLNIAADRRWGVDKLKRAIKRAQRAVKAAA